MKDVLDNELHIGDWIVYQKYGYYGRYNLAEVIGFTPSYVKLAEPVEGEGKRFHCKMPTTIVKLGYVPKKYNNGE